MAIGLAFCSFVLATRKWRRLQPGRRGVMRMTMPVNPRSCDGGAQGEHQWQWRTGSASVAVAQGVSVTLAPSPFAWPHVHRESHHLVLLVHVLL